MRWTLVSCGSVKNDLTCTLTVARRSVPRCARPLGSCWTRQDCSSGTFPRSAVLNSILPLLHARRKIARLAFAASALASSRCFVPSLLSLNSATLVSCPLLHHPSKTYTHALTADITMYEALTRSHEPAHLIAPDVSSAIERIQGVEAKKERRREGQIAEAAKKRMDKKRKQAAEEEANDEGGDAKKAKLDGGAPNEQEEGAVGEEDTAMEDVTAATSAAPTTNGSTPVDSPAPSAPVEESTPAPPTTSNRENKRTQKAEKEKEDRAALPPKLWTFKAGAQTRGHTSYLTFATLLPQSEAPVTTATTATETEKALPAAATVTMPVADAVDGEDEYAMDEADVRALLEVDLTQLPGTAVSKES